MVIQFICRGNALRSIIAEAYLNSLRLPNITVLSSGTCASQHKESNADNFQKTLALLEKHHISHYAKDHYADDLNQHLLDTSDIAVYVNQRAYDEAVDIFKSPDKTYVWDVTDIGEPGRMAATDAERVSLSEDVYAEIVTSVDALVKLHKLGASGSAA